MRLVLIALTILLAMPCSIEAFAVTKSFAAKQLPRTAAFAAPKLTKDENKAATTTATATTTTTTPPTTTALQLLENASRAAAGTATVWVATAQTALADSPDWGLFEGRIGSLLHPAMMASMFVFSISTAILGWQWRRQRTMGDEISALKKTLPDLQGAASVSAALSAAKSAETVDTNRIQTLTAALVTEQQISALVTERKSLAEAGPRDKHYSQGALLAFLGTIFAIEVRRI